MGRQTRSAKAEVAWGRSVDRLDVEDGARVESAGQESWEDGRVVSRRFENGCFSGLTYTSSSTG